MPELSVWVLASLSEPALKASTHICARAVPPTPVTEPEIVPMPVMVASIPVTVLPGWTEMPVAEPRDVAWAYQTWGRPTTVQSMKVTKIVPVASGNKV